MRRASRKESARIALTIGDRVENLFHEVHRALVDAAQRQLVAKDEAHEKTPPFVIVPEGRRCLHEVIRLDDEFLEPVLRGSPLVDVLVELVQLAASEILGGPIAMASLRNGAEAWILIIAFWEMVAEIDVGTLTFHVALEAFGSLREPGVEKAIGTVPCLQGCRYCPPESVHA